MRALVDLAQTHDKVGFSTQSRILELRLQARLNVMGGPVERIMCGSLRRTVGRNTTLVAGLARPVPQNTARFAGRLGHPRWFTAQATEAAPKRHRRFWLVAGGAILVGFGYWKWLTHHNYPPSVAELLRKGLRAEINGAGPQKPDHNAALRYYLEALAEADNLGMNPISDEYTGILLQIADLYERLDMSEDALYIYTELSNMYLVALRANKVAEGSRDMVISRLLKIAIVSGLYLSNEPRLAAKMLLPHLLLAQREVSRKNPALATLLKGSELDDSQFEDLIRGKAGKLVFDSKFEADFGGFRDEYFTMREMQAGLSLVAGDFATARLYKEQTSELMMHSGYPVGDTLMSIVNVASLAVMEATSAHAVKKTVDLRATDSERSDVPTETAPVEPEVLATLRAGSVEQLALALDIYNNVVRTVEGMSVMTRRSGLVPQAHAMAIYGAGVVELQKGNWNSAADKLQEARIRSKGLQIEALLDSVDDELRKLEALRGSTKSREELSDVTMPAIDVMFWKMEPEDWSTPAFESKSDRATRPKRGPPA